MTTTLAQMPIGSAFPPATPRDARIRYVVGRRTALGRRYAGETRDGRPLCGWVGAGFLRRRLLDACACLAVEGDVIRPCWAHTPHEAQPVRLPGIVT